MLQHLHIVLFFHKITCYLAFDMKSKYVFPLYLLRLYAGRIVLNYTNFIDHHETACLYEE